MMRERILSALGGALAAVCDAEGVAPPERPAVRLSVPPSPELGDLSTDLALSLSRQTRRSPLELAEALAARFDAPPGLVDRVEIARSGFLNFYLRADWLAQSMKEALEAGRDFGRSEEPGRGQPLQVEFVSANPTAPLTLAHGRGAALGDALARLMEWSGFAVTREFYVNDTGSQMERFARSLDAGCRLAAGREATVPADGFHHPYVAALAARLQETVGDSLLDAAEEERLAALSRAGRDAMLAQQQGTLERFGVRFDVYRSETDLLLGGRLDEVLARLGECGAAFERDGVLWLRSTAFGDEQDRPLVRSNGRPTYLAGDLAYHLDKFARGFRRVIDVWGPDHETYVRRTLAGVEALGGLAGALDIVVFAPVTLRIDQMVVESVPGGGNNLDEVLNCLGAPTARFLLLARAPGVPVEVDLDLGHKEPGANPCWRVRSVAARAARASPDGSRVETAASPPPLLRRTMRLTADFPDEVRFAARSLDPSRLVRWAGEAADELEALLAGGEPAPGAAAVLAAGAVALRNALEILGLPEGGEGEGA